MKSEALFVVVLPRRGRARHRMTPMFVGSSSKCVGATCFVSAFHSTPMHDPGPEEFWAASAAGSACGGARSAEGHNAPHDGQELWLAAHPGRKSPPLHLLAVHPGAPTGGEVKRSYRLPRAQGSNSEVHRKASGPQRWHPRRCTHSAKSQDTRQARPRCPNENPHRHAPQAREISGLDGPFF